MCNDPQLASTLLQLLEKESPTFLTSGVNHRRKGIHPLFGFNWVRVVADVLGNLQILDQLQRNAKLTNVQLAARVHLSPSPCLARVRALEQAGLIGSYVALLNQLSLGFGVSVFIQIQLDKQVRRALDQFEAAMSKHPAVMECYLMTGDSDYLIRVVLTDVQAVENFIVEELSKIPGVAHIRSSFAIKQVKYQTALPLPRSRSTQ